MTLEFQRFTEQTDPMLISQAAALINGQIIQDSKLTVEETAGNVDVTDPELEVYGMVDGASLFAVGTVMRAGLLVPGKVAGTQYEVGMLAVQPEYHGRGIGRALLSHIERQVLDNGGKGIWIVPTPGSRAFYRKLGYAPDPAMNVLHREVSTSDVLAPIPEAPAYKDIVASGSLADNVRLGIGLLERAVGGQAMAQIYLRKAHRTISSAGGNHEEMVAAQQLLAEAVMKLEETEYGLLGAAIARLRGYVHRVTQG